jgi:hypothetical protein
VRVRGGYALWQRVPITLKKDIPFIDGHVSINGEDPIPVILYIDSAAGGALEFMVSDTMKFPLSESMEEQYLGTGLSGDIHGSVGRIAAFGFGGYVLHDVPTSFPPAEVRSKQEGADGIIGNNALRRFNLIFDYSRELIYIRPNATFGASCDAHE